MTSLDTFALVVTFVVPLVAALAAVVGVGLILARRS